MKNNIMRIVAALSLSVIMAVGGVFVGVLPTSVYASVVTTPERVVTITSNSGTQNHTLVAGENTFDIDGVAVIIDNQQDGGTVRIGKRGNTSCRVCDG